MDRNSDYRNDRRGRRENYGGRRYRERERESYYEDYPYGKRGQGRRERGNGYQHVPEVDDKDLLSKYEKRLNSLKDSLLLEEIKITNSKWGVKPKGFENITAQQAKISGLFPLPGAPNVQEGQDPTSSTNSLQTYREFLDETSKLNAKYSRTTKRVLLKNINFNVFKPNEIAQAIDKYLSRIDITQTSLSNIQEQFKVNNILVLEFENVISAMILLSLNGQSFPIDKYNNSSSQNDKTDIEGESANTFLAKSTLLLDVERPGEYVIQSEIAISEDKRDDITAVESTQAVVARVSKNETESSLAEKIERLNSVRHIQILREVGTKESLGICFLDFNFDEITDIKDRIKKVSELVAMLNGENYIESAKLAYLETEETAVQDCSVDFSSLKKLVKNEFVSLHPKLNVIQLINAVSPKEIRDKAELEFIINDIVNEVSKYGRVKSVKVPQPNLEYYQISLSDLPEPHVGRIFIELEDEDSALNAIMKLAGRLYNDRVVICAFFDYNDYKNELF